MLKEGTLVRVDSQLIRAIDNALREKLADYQGQSQRRRRSTVNDAGEGEGENATPGHPFDAHLINYGTAEAPQYAIEIYNSALPDSPYAGIVYIGTATYSVPVDELTIEAGEVDYFAVDLVVTYDAENSPVYTLEFEVRTDSDYEDEDNVFRQTIAEGILPEIASEVSGNIRITDRWV